MEALVVVETSGIKIRLVGQAGEPLKGDCDHSRAWRLVQLGKCPSIPQLRGPHRIERRHR